MININIDNKAKGAIFENAMLRNVDYSHCLKGLNFDHADMAGANLKDSRLVNVSFRNAVLVNARFGDTFYIRKIPAPRYGSTKGDGNTLRSVDFSDADIRGGNFTNVSLADVDFTGANLAGAVFTRSIFKKGVRFEGANLEDADFTWVKWGGEDLCNAESIGCCVLSNGRQALEKAGCSPAYGGYSCPDKANLRGLDFSGLHFPGHNLKMMPFIKADFRESNFERSKISHADLSGADFRDAKLNGATIVMSDAHGADFSGADMSHGKFDLCSMVGAILKNTNLNTASFYKTDLTGADLSGAALAGANFSRATWTDGRICAGGSIGECK